MKYGRTTAGKPASATTLGNACGKLVTCGVDFGIAVENRLALRILRIIATTFFKLRQLTAQATTFLVVLGLTLGVLDGSLFPLLATRLVKARGSLFPGLVPLDHLGLDLDLLGTGAWPLAEMHLPLGIGPTVDFGRGQSRQQQGPVQQKTHEVPPWKNLSSIKPFVRKRTTTYDNKRQTKGWRAV